MIDVVAEPPYNGPLREVSNLIVTVQNLKVQSPLQEHVKDDLSKHLTQVLALMEVAWAYPQDLSHDQVFAMALDALQVHVHRMQEDLASVASWRPWGFCCRERTDITALATHGDLIARWAVQWTPKMRRLLLQHVQKSPDSS
mmetsp:Transcript_141747/g.440691  ORF Transcript_141747/g.440691 Transcript_141747/m.440691 type:complete len:142 (-) Transcript_141747:104-529(-)